MLRFSANLGFLWPDRPLIDRIDAAAAAGFKAIELHWPYDVPAEAVRHACARHRLSLLGLNTPPGDAAKGDFGLGAVPGREREFRKGFDHAVAYCRASGAAAIHTLPGIVPTELQSTARAVFRANLMEAAGKAAAHGLTVLLEAINPRDKPGYFYSRVGEVAAWIEELARPNLRLLFDVYHVAVAEGDVLARISHQSGGMGEGWVR